MKINQKTIEEMIKEEILKEEWFDTEYEKQGRSFTFLGRTIGCRLESEFSVYDSGNNYYNKSFDNPNDAKRWFNKLVRDYIKKLTTTIDQLHELIFYSEE